MDSSDSYIRMTELQAAIEIQVELGKFYNVDLFQRGYYQIRTSLKTAPKAPTKVEVSLPKNSANSLVFPASVINGVAVSKTFQILYRGEDVTLNDIVLFKVPMLVDSLKIAESIEQADFQVCVDLWFSDEDFCPELHEKLQCISQRTLNLHLTPTRGIHHHLPLLFDYFHLSSVTVTIHATLIALHQPYLCMPKQPKAAWTAKAEQSTLESVLFGNSSRSPTLAAAYALTERTRLQQACHMHRVICGMLLATYESLQDSFEEINNCLPPRKQVPLDHVDCYKRLDCLMQIASSFEDEEDFLQTAQTDVSQLCGENVILWSQYLDLVTLSDTVQHHLAKQHHLQRVKRFAEGFFSFQNAKKEMLSCYDPDSSNHNYSNMAATVRDSDYLRNIPPLAVECIEMDGDQATWPLIFEDFYVEWSQHKPDPKESEKKVNRNDSQSSHSTLSSESASPQLRHGKQKNRKSELIKRQSMFAPTEIRANVAGIEEPDCTLIGYRKLNSNSLSVTTTPTPVVELGTLQSDDTDGIGDVDYHPTLHNAISVPILHGRSQLNISVSGSMPDLSDKTTSLVQKLSGSSAPSAGSEPSLSKNSTDAIPSTTYLGFKKIGPGGENLGSTGSNEMGSVPEVMKSGDLMESILQEVSKNGDCSSSTSTSNNAIENGYLSSRSSDFDKSPLGDSDESSTGVSGSAASEQVLINKHRIPQSNFEESIDEADEATENSIVTDSQAHNGATSTAWGEGGKPLDIQENQGGVHVSSIDLSDVTDSLQNIGTSAHENRNLTRTDDENVGGKYTVNELLKEELLLSQRNNVLSHDVACSGDAAVTESNVLATTPVTPASRRIGMANHSYNRHLHSASQTSLTAARRRPYSMIATSASNPELSSSLEAYRLPEKLVSPVDDAVMIFAVSKENLRAELKFQGTWYSDRASQVSTEPYFWPCDSHEVGGDDGIHLIICVHGLDGNSADLRLVRMYIEMALPGGRIDFLMSERNQPDTFADFEEMTDRLVQEILHHIDVYGMKPSRISFVGHSLGNLIIRSALTRHAMAPLLPKLYTMLSLSGPHLGTLYNSSGLVNMGMWLMQKWKKSGSLLQLSLKDHPDPRETFLYKLSQKPGLEFFRNVLVVGSQQDRYVPYHSSRIELCKAAIRDTSGMGSVYAEMVANLLQPIVFKSDIEFVRYDVFHALPNTTNTLIGRAAHIAVLDSELFLEKFMLVVGLKYFM